MEDTLGGMEDEEEMEEEAEAEVDRILFEVTAGKEPHDHHPMAILSRQPFLIMKNALAQNFLSSLGLG